MPRAIAANHPGMNLEPLKRGCGNCYNTSDVHDGMNSGRILKLQCVPVTFLTNLAIMATVLVHHYNQLMCLRLTIHCTLIYMFSNCLPMDPL